MDDVAAGPTFQSTLPAIRLKRGRFPGLHVRQIKHRVPSIETPTSQIFVSGEGHMATARDDEAALKRVKRAMNGAHPLERPLAMTSGVEEKNKSSRTRQHSDIELAELHSDTLFPSLSPGAPVQDKQKAVRENQSSPCQTSSSVAQVPSFVEPCTVPAQMKRKIRPLSAPHPSDSDGDLFRACGTLLNESPRRQTETLWPASDTARRGSEIPQGQAEAKRMKSGREDYLYESSSRTGVKESEVVMTGLGCWSSASAPTKLAEPETFELDLLDF